jgi:hypothetical protein
LAEVEKVFPASIEFCTTGATSTIGKESRRPLMVLTPFAANLFFNRTTMSAAGKSAWQNKPSSSSAAGDNSGMMIVSTLVVASDPIEFLFLKVLWLLRLQSQP